MGDDGAFFDTIIARLSEVFTAPSREIFARLALSWVICTGRKTVINFYRLAEPLRERAHDAYHRFLRQGAWSLSELWRIVACLLVAAFCPEGRMPIDLDDTLFHKSGRKIEDAAWWREAVASTGQRVVHAFWLNLVVLTLRVKAPWGGEPLGVPVNLRLHRKGGKSLLDLAAEAVVDSNHQEARRWVTSWRQTAVYRARKARIVVEWQRCSQHMGYLECNIARYC